MKNRIDVSVPLEGRLWPKEIEILTKEVRTGDCLVRLKFEVKKSLHGFYMIPDFDDEFAGGCGALGMTD